MTPEEYIKNAFEIGEQRVKDCDFEPTTMSVDSKDVKEYGILIAKETAKKIFEDLKKEMVGSSDSLWQGFELVEKKYLRDD